MKANIKKCQRRNYYINISKVNVDILNIKGYIEDLAKKQIY